MNCPQCRTRLAVTHTYSTPNGKTQGAECSECGKRFTLVTFLACEIEEKGQGPFALAKRLREGADPRAL